MEKESYTFQINQINTLMNNHFDLTNEDNTWSKERLTSIKLLSDVFNSYVDLAQDTMNFTELNNLTENQNKKFQKSLLKNLLFIFKIVQDKNISLNTILQSLESNTQGDL